jgi:Zn finger protein HypA/HybF involved in hydrogenase expression
MTQTDAEIRCWFCDAPWPYGDEQPPHLGWTIDIDTMLGEQREKVVCPNCQSTAMGLKGWLE